MYPPAQQDGKHVRIPSPIPDIEEGQDDHELDTHVKNVLASSKRAKAKRAGRGFWAFVKTPIGAFTAIYGFLCAFWGAAIVLFLLGWIPTSSKDTQDKWVEISSQVCNGLFTVTGVGLIPWRVIDTYRGFLTGCTSSMLNSRNFYHLDTEEEDRETEEETRSTPNRRSKRYPRSSRSKRLRFCKSLSKHPQTLIDGRYSQNTIKSD
jgi:hypothetical protein